MNPGYDFDYFLSSGLPGKIEGECYKKSSKLVKESLKNWPDFLAALFTLADFDEARPEALRASLGSGCSSIFIVTYPYFEKYSKGPRVALGLFDQTDRPYKGQNQLSFVVPMKNFRGMIDNIKKLFNYNHNYNHLAQNKKKN